MGGRTPEPPPHKIMLRIGTKPHADAASESEADVEPTKYARQDTPGVGTDQPGSSSAPGPPKAVVVQGINRSSEGPGVSAASPDPDQAVQAEARPAKSPGLMAQQPMQNGRPEDYLAISAPYARASLPPPSTTPHVPDGSPLPQDGHLMDAAEYDPFKSILRRPGKSECLPH
jgi:hypothetical protein